MAVTNNSVYVKINSNYFVDYKECLPNESRIEITCGTAVAMFNMTLQTPSTRKSWCFGGRNTVTYVFVHETVAPPCSTSHGAQVLIVTRVKACN